MKLIASFAAMMVASTQAASLVASAEQYYGGAPARSPSPYSLQGSPQHYGRVENEFQRRLGDQQSRDQNRYNQNQNAVNQRNQVNAYNQAYAPQRQQRAAQIIQNRVGSYAPQSSSYGQQQSPQSVYGGYGKPSAPSRPTTSYGQKPTYNNGGRPTAPAKNTYGGYGGSVQNSAPYNAYGSSNGYGQNQYSQPKPSYGQPAAPYGQPQQSYGQRPAYQQQAPKASPYGSPYGAKPVQQSYAPQTQNFNAGYMNRYGNQYQQPSYSKPTYQQPQQPSYVQQPQQPSYNQQPQQPSYGQQPQQPSYAQQPSYPQQPSYVQQPQQPSYAQQPSYPQQQPSYNTPAPVATPSIYANSAPKTTTAPPPASYTKPEFNGPPKGFGFQNNNLSTEFNAGWQPPTGIKPDNAGSSGQQTDSYDSGSGFGGGFSGFHDISDGYYEVEEPIIEETPVVEEIIVEDIVEDVIEYDENGEEIVEEEWDGPAFFHPDAVEARYQADPTRNPYTGEYMGRAERESRPERPKYDRAPVRDAYSRPKRTPYVPVRSQIPEGQLPVVEEKDSGYAIPDTQPGYTQADPWDSIDDGVFEVPDMEHPDHTPGNALKNHEFIIGEPMKALDVQKEKNPFEDQPEEKSLLDDDEEDGEEDPELEKEPYMTKEYYLPGYVDPTPPKEYPPHIRMFKDYIATIGDFKKHSMDDEESYAPDVGISIDTDDFGSGSGGYAPYTGNFSAGAGNSYKPSYDAFTPVNQVTGYKPTGQDYGGNKPSAIDYGEYKPTGQDYGNFKPASVDYGNYKPSSVDYGNYKPSAVNYGNFRPSAQTYGNFRPQVGSYGGYGAQSYAPTNSYGSGYSSSPYGGAPQQAYY